MLQTHHIPVLKITVTVTNRSLHVSGETLETFLIKVFRICYTCRHDSMVMAAGCIVSE